MRRKSGRRFSPVKDGFTLLLIVILGALILAKVDGLSDRRFSGRFIAIDGDTLASGKTRYRLLGIDAPELRQSCGVDDQSWACGQAARDFLRDVLDRGEVECSGSKTDKYSRLLVRCSFDGKDVGSLVVAEGLAVTTEFFLYAQEEEHARTQRLGLWSGAFERPRDWRRERNGMDDDRPFAGIITMIRHVLRW